MRFLLKVLFFLSMLALVTTSYPMVHRSTGIFGGSASAGVAMKLNQRWMGVTVVLCVAAVAMPSFFAEGVCIGAMALSATTSVTAIVAAGQTSGSSSLGKGT